jgi:ABC-type amino acid transport substrate-binding protein
MPTPIAVFTVGVNPEFEPFVFQDENGNLAGFDIDLLNALSAAGDFEFGYATTSFNGLLQGLNSSAFDAAMSAITVTDERRRTVDFTEPYFGSGQAVVSYLSAGQGIAVRNDNTTILGPEQLTDGVRVGVKANTTGERYVVDQTAADFVRFEEAPQALDALVAGEIDAVVVDIPVITYYIRDNPAAGIKLAGGPVTEELYAIAVSKSEPELLAVLNAALQQIAGDGTYDQIFTKWFGSP